MTTAHAILLALALAALAARPRAAGALAVIVVAAGLDLLLGVGAGAVPGVVGPLTLFLAAALTLAGLAEAAGLAERGAEWLARRAAGRTAVLYGLVCALCAALTAVVSLDGAVVLMVPLLLALARRTGAPLGPLFLGSVAVANAASIAVPGGNPTNLVVMERVGLSAGAFTAHMAAPGLAAALAGALLVAARERRALAGRYVVPEPGPVSASLSRAERHALAALLAAAVAAWVAPLAGVTPWWPFAAVVGLAVATAPRRARIVVPWRLALLVAGLLVLADGAGLHLLAPGGPGLAAALVVTAVVALAAALANNLPVSVWAAGLLVAGPTAYAATVGLGVGSLATPHGSVATLIAQDLAGPTAPRLRTGTLAPVALAALVAATLVLAATG